MATIKAMIRATKGKDTAFVRFRISDGRNKQLFYKSDISVNVALWDSRKECISTRKVCNIGYRNEINNAIHDLKTHLYNVYENHATKIKTSADLTNYVKGNVSFLDCFSTFPKLHVSKCINHYVDEKGETISENAQRHYLYLSTCLMRYTLIQNEMGKTCNFEDINNITETDINEFCKFAKTEYKYVPLYSKYYTKKVFKIQSFVRPPRRERSNNTIIKHLQNLHSVFKWLLRNGIINKDPMSNYKMQSEIYGTPYYLTKQERDYITNFDLSKYPQMEIARDAFIFQCFIGCRFSDLKRLTKDNINNGYIEYIPQKTNKTSARLVRVPLHETAKRIVKKYIKLGNSTLFPISRFVGKQNEKIKGFFTIMKITRKVSVFNSVTMQEEHKPLNEVASTHLARRTFIGLLYKQIKDPCIISSMSGHAPNSRAFARYRTIDDEIKNETINLL